MPKIRTTKAFYWHTETGDVYAIEISWGGHIVGGCGPLAEGDLPNLDELEYTDKLNSWLRKNNEKLVLMGEAET